MAGWEGPWGRPGNQGGREVPYLQIRVGKRQRKEPRKGRKGAGSGRKGPACLGRRAAETLRKVTRLPDSLEVAGSWAQWNRKLPTSCRH